MSFWKEIQKGFDKLEQAHGTATAILGKKVVDYAPQGEPANQPAVIAPAPAEEGKASPLSDAKAWFMNLPQPARYGAYALGGLGAVAIARKLLK